MLANSGVQGAYIVHGITGYESREKFLEGVFNNQQILPFEFVTEYQDSALNEELIKKYFTEDIRTVLGKGALFCTLVHMLIYEKVIKNDNEFALVFENDVCFIDSNFLEKLKPIVEEAKQLEKGFIISLENTTLEFPSWRVVKKNKLLYKAKSGRCAGAYLIDKKAAVLMMEDAINKKCSKVIDWWHNDLIDRGVITMYWAHPSLTEQGSFNGKMTSSISIRNNGTIRRWRWLAQKYYKMYILRIFR